MRQSLMDRAHELVRNDPPTLVSAAEYRRVIEGLVGMLEYAVANTADWPSGWGFSDKYTFFDWLEERANETRESQRADVGE